MSESATSEMNPAPAPRTVSEFLGGDHRRLDAIFRKTGELAAAGSFAEAEAVFSGFASGLSRHIAMEETVLFPAFEAKTGMTEGPTAVMRREHTEIRRLLSTIAAALAASDGSAFDMERVRLLEVLEAHNQKEEGILYPMSDRIAGGDREREDLIRRMQAV
jgi:hemerythrin-like domain-containing protein